MENKKMEDLLLQLSENVTLLTLTVKKLEERVLKLEKDLVDRESDKKNESDSLWVV